MPLLSVRMTALEAAGAEEPVAAQLVGEGDLTACCTEAEAAAPETAEAGAMAAGSLDRISTLSKVVLYYIYAKLNKKFYQSINQFLKAVSGQGLISLEFLLLFRIYIRFEIRIVMRLQHRVKISMLFLLLPHCTVNKLKTNLMLLRRLHELGFVF
jgi:hypothetical protein